ncbi:PREDICTED: acyl-CoA-binding domain-containing protein 5 [Nicrophorus vespilloides]|uniref:Acyl-CoA-binding domain-containing protein 5 n=1 Tax=Nicrophorus vespilloides TaxID=110193 RepID=A0ABM1N466_NICVS|nr:PREDICTED: acyl-CoA-binding domain-containing protein 5 [Nicrophorus vespilloides]
MTTEQKFHAAVNVIRSLPKNGSYQPSNDLMLRFYGYFKQATQGKCTGTRPSIWQVVSRAKYDAWKKLGDMSKADAMARYVEELHTIVETMSYSDKVANFLDAPNRELDSLNIEDLQLVVGDVIERVRSQPNSPLGSREASPNRLVSSLSSSRSMSPTSEETEQDSDHSDGEFMDTIETIEHKKHIPTIVIPTEQRNGHVARPKTRQNSIDISQEVAKAVQSLKTDIDNLGSKVHALEKNRMRSQRSKGIFGLSASTLVFIVIWPFVANFIMHRYRSRNA